MSPPSTRDPIPLFGLLAGWLLPAEPVSAALVLAMILVAVGISLVNRVPDGDRIV